MRNAIIVSAAIVLMLAGVSHAGFFDELFKSAPKAGSSAGKPEVLDEATIVSGLLEALEVGAGNAVSSISKVDGYFTNEAIKILMPPNVRQAADLLEMAGFNKQVDDFVLSMNRAAEMAAPKALPLLTEAIKQTTFDDAKKILNGSDTAATDYFRTKTFDSLYGEFKPVISASMNDAGVTQYYKALMDSYSSTIPFASSISVDLDDYVTNGSIDGLFRMVAEEEKKIRSDPAARVTDTLKEVFGR